METKILIANNNGYEKSKSLPVQELARLTSEPKHEPLLVVEDLRESQRLANLVKGFFEGTTLIERQADAEKVETIDAAIDGEEWWKRMGEYWDEKDYKGKPVQKLEDELLSANDEEQVQQIVTRYEDDATSTSEVRTYLQRFKDLFKPALQKSKQDQQPEPTP